MKKQKGFSFIEIMIVIVLIAGIMGLVGPALFSKLDEAKVKQAKIQMQGISAALDLYRLDNSVFPSTEQGLEALISKPEIGKVPVNWKGPYLKSPTVPADPWNYDYVYQSNGSEIEVLMSYGGDGEEGGDGIDSDITLK